MIFLLLCVLKKTKKLSLFSLFFFCCFSSFLCFLTREKTKQKNVFFYSFSLFLSLIDAQGVERFRNSPLPSLWRKEEAEKKRSSDQNSCFFIFFSLFSLSQRSLSFSLPPFISLVVRSCSLCSLCARNCFISLIFVLCLSPTDKKSKTKKTHFLSLSLFPLKTSTSTSLYLSKRNASLLRAPAPGGRLGRGLLRRRGLFRGRLFRGGGLCFLFIYFIFIPGGNEVRFFFFARLARFFNQEKSKTTKNNSLFAAGFFAGAAFFAGAFFAAAVVFFAAGFLAAAVVSESCCCCCCGRWR